MFIKKASCADIPEKLEDGTVLTNVETGETFTVNETGAFFLSFLDDEGRSVDDIISKLKGTFNDVPYDDLHDDFIAYMNELAQSDLVKFGETLEELTLEPLNDLHVELTMQCNERCVHCYLPNKIKNEGSTLSVIEFCNIVDEFVQLGGEQIVLSGGEPMKHPDFLAMVEHCYKNNLSISILSNLTLLNDHMIEKLKSYKVSNFQVSIYSMEPEVHDSITKYRGSLVKSLSALEKLRENGFSVTVSCPIMSQNENNLRSLYEYCEKNGIPLRSNAHIISQTDGNTSFLEQHRLTQKEKKELYSRMAKEMPHYIGKFLTQASAKSNLREYTDWFSRQPICSAGINTCSISPDGDVYPCPEWKTFKLGNIYEQSLSEIWKTSEKLKEIRRYNKRKSFPKCLSCEAIDHCKICLNMNRNEEDGGTTNISQYFCDEAFMKKELCEQCGV